MKKNIFKEIVVKKPWGYEYLIYQNKYLAIWVLKIDEGQSTSMHCHSKKLTGLICLNGKTEISFLNEKKVVEPLNKIMIRKGLFHQSKSISIGGSFLIEVETPVDKEDLIRLIDQYGREKETYEKNYLERKEEHVFINNKINKTYVIENKYFQVKRVKDISDLIDFHEDNIFVILSGGFNKIVEDKKLFVLQPGDCLYSSIFKKITSTIENVCEDTKVLIVSKEKV